MLIPSCHGPQASRSRDHGRRQRNPFLAPQPSQPSEAVPLLHG
jgi:hypothetical protein